MRLLFCLLVAGCGRELTEIPVNAFKGSWSGVAYSSTLDALHEARVSFSDDAITWRLDRQPGPDDELVLEGSYRTNESQVMSLTFDRARIERPGGGESLLRQGTCFTDTAGACVAEAQQSSPYIVSALNVQFNVSVRGVTIVTNCNRDP